MILYVVKKKEAGFRRLTHSLPYEHTHNLLTASYFLSHPLWGY